MSASCDWPSGIPTSLSSFPLQEGLVLTPTCRALHSSVSPEAPTPVLGEQHVISRIFLQSGVQMGYDGLENPLFCLKVRVSTEAMHWFPIFKTKKYTQLKLCGA